MPDSLENVPAEAEKVINRSISTLEYTSVTFCGTNETRAQSTSAARCCAAVPGTALCGGLSCQLSSSFSHGHCCYLKEHGWYSSLGVWQTFS